MFSNQQENFNKVTLYCLIAASLLFFIGGIAIVFYYSPPRTPLPNSKSYSAVGHHALFSILKEDGSFKVYRSFQNIYTRTPPKCILFLEPNLADWYSYAHRSFAKSLKEMLKQGNTVVVSCPKWSVVARSSKNPQWISKARIIPQMVANYLLQSLNCSLEVINHWQNKVKVVNPWGKNWYVDSLQLQVFLPDANARVLVATADGYPIVCQYQINKGTLVMISDPEIFNNIAIGRANNGEIMLALLKDLSKGMNICIDEICHGMGRPRSLVQVVLTFPILCITLHVVLIVLCWVCYVAVRFHPASSSPENKYHLKEQIAALANVTYQGKRHDYFLREYLKNTIEEVANLYPACNDFAFTDKLKFLDKIDSSIGKIYKKALGATKNTDILEIAKGIHKWQKKMTSLKKYTT